MVNNVLEGLKSHANSSCVCPPILNETVAKNSKIILFHKRADNRLSNIQKGIIFATSSVLEIADEPMLAH